MKRWSRPGPRSSSLCRGLVRPLAVMSDLPLIVLGISTSEHNPVRTLSLKPAGVLELNVDFGWRSHESSVEFVLALLESHIATDDMTQTQHEPRTSLHCTLQTYEHDHDHDDGRSSHVFSSRPATTQWVLAVAALCRPDIAARSTTLAQRFVYIPSASTY
ncbi:hypothetical protein J6590_028635 [Homalodisca vitripennis]|nr:hypothetical protein J6590_028635 [Homalodisca vitripennis]